MLGRTRNAIWALFAREVTGATLTAVDLAGVLDVPARTSAERTAGVAVIPVTGLIMQHASVWSRYGLATATEDLVAQIRAAVADPAIRSIVLDMESPGGFVYGVQEAADAIRTLREQKPIHAVANSYAASAAYWLASAASTLMVTPSGEVGSIGVFAVHEDWSNAYAQMGVTPTVVKAGRYKAEFTDTAPLSDEARAALQTSVDESYEAFVRGVAAGRGVTPAAVRDGFGEGRMVPAAKAVAAGMADRVATIDALVARLTPTPRGAKADGETRRRVLRHRAR